MNSLPRLTRRFTVLLIALAGMTAFAEPPGNGEYVSRKEYEQLKKEFEAFKTQTADLMAQRKANAPTGPDQATQEYLEFLDQQLKEVKQVASSAQAGSTKFLLSGYAASGYTDRKNANSTFGAMFAPIFLWQLNDRLLFQGELEFETETGDDGGVTNTELEYAEFSYIVNDYVTVGAGKFLTPFGTFSERLHPAWINKLPDKPLPFGHDGLAPVSSIGAYVRGGFPVGQSMKGNYAVYVSNGPTLNLGAMEAAEAGFLHFNNHTDIDNNKAVGGRFGLLPLPGLEIGYSFQFARISPDGFDTVDAVLHDVDVTYVCDSEALGGAIDFRFEWVLSDVEDAVYDPTGTIGFGPAMFDNKREGGYAQIAYRPSKSNDKIIKNLEGVFRYDWLNNPDDAPESFDEQRYTCGLNYWISPSTVLKVAYQFDNKAGGDAVDTNAFFLQTAIGF